VKGTSYSKVPTGIEGLDSMLEGGLPKGRIILVRGSPGAGKSILCSHYLFNGATKFGENGIYVSLEESKHQLFREMKLFDMDFKSLEEENQVAFIDASPIRHTPAETKLGNIRVGRRDFSLMALGKLIQTKAEEWKAERIVIDPLTALSLQYSDDIRRWEMMLDLLEILGRTSATCILTEDLRAPSLAGEIPIEDYAVHGVILMQSLEMGKGAVKTIRIVKMRESKHDDQTRIYQIDEAGIVVYPTTAWSI